MSEILGSLFKTIVALLALAGITLVANQVFGANKTSDHLANLHQMNLNIQALYSTQGSYTSLTNTVIISGHLAPKSMTVTGSLLNPWGGAVTVVVNSGNASQYDATDASVPAESCAKVATGQSTLVGLKINGAAQTLPADAGALVTACNLASNTLIYTYSR
ncbi:MAG: type 4 pilus major pilin [Pseudomonadota bacterium]